MPMRVIRCTASSRHTSASSTQRFVRGLKESAVPGVGLGLAICDTIVRAHGGSMRAENRSPRGARFVFTLPLEAAPQAGREQPGTPREEPSSTPRAPS